MYRHRGRRTPPKYVRGTSDYDYYKEPMNYLERERQERLNCISGCTVILIWILIFLL